MNATTTRCEVERRLNDPVSILQSDGVAFVGPDVPIEVLLASGRPFGHLPWRVSRTTPWADRWLESSFPFWARSILEQWHAGAFDAIGQVVFSRGDDASQRLYYYVRELRARGKLAGPSPLMFDLALVPRESSVLHLEAAVLELARVLGVAADALAAGVASANRLRRQLAAIEAGRAGDGPFFERFARAALWTGPTEWLESASLPLTACAGPRVLLAGSMPADERLHEAVEISGASIVAEDHALASDRFGPELVVNAEPVCRAIARHLQAHSVSPRAFFDRAERVLARARAVRAGAVVLWLAREDEALSWSLPALRQALAAAGLPALILPAARWRSDDDTLDTITDFCRGAARATA